MAEPIRNFDTMLEAVREWVGRMHAVRGQLWVDGRPYLHHLTATEEVLTRFGFVGPKSHTLRIAALVHDMVRDTDVTLERVRWYQGPEVETLVASTLVLNATDPSRNQSVSRIKDTEKPCPQPKNRAEYQEKIYPKLAMTSQATALKLASRIADAEACAKAPAEVPEGTVAISCPFRRKVALHAKEYEEFRQALWLEGVAESRMWDHLDNLMAAVLASPDLEQMLEAAQAQQKAPASAATPVAGTTKVEAPSPVLEPLPALEAQALVPLEPSAWIM